jgi:hypothetical protein
MMTVAPRSSRSQILRMPFRPFIPNSGNPISRARSSTVKTSRNVMSWRRIGDIAIPAASSRPSAIERDGVYGFSLKEFAVGGGHCGCSGPGCQRFLRQKAGQSQMNCRDRNRAPRLGAVSLYFKGTVVMRCLASKRERLWQQVRSSGSTAKRDLASFSQMMAATMYSFISAP